MGITLKLAELEKQLELSKSPALRLFLEGLPVEHIRLTFKNQLIQPPKDLVALYQWRNGLRSKDIPVGLLSFGVNGVFLPLHESVEAYREMKEDGFSSYFPIFSDDSFWINVDTDSKDYGKIFFYSPSMQILEPQSRFDSLEQMVETFITCFKEGIFWYDEDGYFEEDYDRSYEIAKLINPKSTYWLLP